MTDVPNQILPLVIREAPDSIRRLYRWPLRVSVGAAVVLGVACIAAAWLSVAIVSSSGSLVGLLPLGMSLLGIAYCVHLVRSTARRAETHASMSFTIRLSDRGMDWSTGQGDLVLPWEVIDSMTIRNVGPHRLVTFHLTAGVDSTGPGVRSTMSPAVFRRVGKKGLQLGSAGIDVPIDAVVAAAAAFTGGRLTAR